MNKKRRYILFFVFMMLGYSNAAAQTDAEEYNLKAAFMYNFTNFIEWQSNANDESVFIIGIMGPSMIRGPLEEIARTKTVKNKKIIIREFSKPEDISSCNILFIPANCPFHLNDILSRVPKSTLTVAEKKNYALAGACINFVVVQNKLKFETNLNAMETAGLKASAHLLKLAIIVN